jgi:hypothetical protein
MSRMRVAEALREPPAAPMMTGGRSPEGGVGRARYAWVRLSALCHLACHASMASCLDVACWWAIVFGSRWFGGRAVVAEVRARSMQRRIPAIETSDGHHSSVTWVFLKTERIWVSVVQNSRECDLSRVGTEVGDGLIQRDRWCQAVVCPQRGAGASCFLDLAPARRLVVTVRGRCERRRGWTRR